VSTDTFPNPQARTNQPYSFTHSLLNLSADYRLPKKIKLGAGLDYDIYKRNLQDIDRTNERTLWGKVNAPAGEYADLMFKYAHANRDVSAYQANPEIDPPQNPLMRKYNMADRDRDTIGLHTDITPNERINVGVGVDYAWDNYAKSQVGLQDGTQSNVSGDLSISLTEKTSLNFFVNREQIKSTQAASQTFTTADWFARNVDRTNTAGLGVKHHANDKLDVGADLAASRSTGQISVTGGTPGFPDLTTNLTSVKLYSTYRLKKSTSLHAAYWYERYAAKDWTIDGVASGTIPDVITLGQGDPSYHVNVVTLSVRYSF
jgi:MtrB/PioB family decaheme-associated outer membrane protein